MISFKMNDIEYRFFDHLFAVSHCGKVLRKMVPYEPRDGRKDGYLTLGRQRLMHRVIATCWIPNTDNAKHVHHKNENKSDNRADNLEWVTPKVHFTERHHGISGYYKRSPETCKKISVWRTGRKDSEETRALKAVGLAINCPKTPCSFKGVLYPSVAAGGRAAGIPPSSFRLRCLSKNFPEYELNPSH